MKKIILVILPLIGTRLLAHECPEQSSLVTYEHSYKDKISKFCQTTKDGEIVKHGLEVVTTKSGKEISRMNYNFGKEARLQTSGLPSISKKADSSCTGMQERFKYYLKKFGNVSNPSGMKERVVVSNTELCRAYPMERLAFVMSGTPYTNEVFFRKQCHMAGPIRFETGKKLNTTLKLRNFDEYDTLSFSYEWKRQKSGQKINFGLSIPHGIFSSNDKKHTLEFSYEQKIEVNMQEAMLKGGKGGIYTLPPKMNLKKVNGNDCGAS